MKQQILVDMDGVMADVYAQFIKMEYEETGNKIDISTLDGKKEKEAFPHYDKHINTKGFFRTVPVMPGSIEVLKYLSEKYRILIVSSCTEYPDSPKEKIEWLNQYFPYISWERMIFCGDKDSIVGDIMIDDHADNLDVFDGKKILFTQPHNTEIKDSKYERADSWEQIKKML